MLDVSKLNPQPAYAKAKSSVIAVVPLVDTTHGPHIYIADPEAIKIVSGDRFTFQKDVEAVRLSLLSAHFFDLTFFIVQSSADVRQECLRHRGYRLEATSRYI